MKRLKCLKCEKELKYLKDGSINKGGALRVSFFHGSRHFLDTARACICDDCFENHANLFWNQCRISKSPK